MNLIGFPTENEPWRLRKKICWSAPPLPHNSHYVVKKESTDTFLVGKIVGKSWEIAALNLTKQGGGAIIFYV